MFLILIKTFKCIDLNKYRNKRKLNISEINKKKIITNNEKSLFVRLYIGQKIKFLY